MLFLLAQATDFLIAVSYHQLHAYIVELWHNDWLSIPQYFIPIAWLTAAGLSFSPNARPWFRKPIRS